MTVQVVTDSSCCISSGVLAELGIRHLPLHVLQDGIALPDDPALPVDSRVLPALPGDVERVGYTENASSGTTEEVSAGDVSPDNSGERAWLNRPGLSTSAVNEEELASAYEEALAKSSQQGVVAVHLSGALSTTFVNAQRAAARFGEAVQVIDSRQVAMGVGYSVLAAAQAARGGASVEEVAQSAKDTSSKVFTWGYVDKLDSLRRSGRIPRTVWLVGAALAIRPVLRIGEGKLHIAERTRTRAKALEKLVDLAQSRFGTQEIHIAIRHQDAEDEAAHVAHALSERMNLSATIDIGALNRSLGAHLGKGAVVLSAFTP